MKITLNKIRRLNPSNNEWTLLVNWLAENHPEIGGSDSYKLWLASEKETPDGNVAFPVSWVAASNNIETCCYFLGASDIAPKLLRKLALEFIAKTEPYVNHPYHTACVATAKQYARNMEELPDTKLTYASCLIACLEACSKTERKWLEARLLEVIETN